jgi:hypothetical protein
MTKALSRPGQIVGTWRGKTEYTDDAESFRFYEKSSEVVQKAVGVRQKRYVILIGYYRMMVGIVFA